MTPDTFSASRQQTGITKRATLIALLLLAVLLFAGWWVFLRQPPRPMFHSVYGRHEFGIRKHWVPDPCAMDDYGNIGCADRAINLLVVAVNLGRPEVGYWGGMRSSANRARFTFSGEGYDVEAIVDRQHDRAVFITRDGIQPAVPIDAGEAALVVDSFRASASAQSNLIAFIAENEDLSDGLREEAQRRLSGEGWAETTNEADD